MAPSLRRPVLLLLAAAVAAIPTSTAFLLPPPPSCRSPSSTHRLAAAPAQAEAAAAAIAEGDDDDGTTRLRLGVYIEHTDRYGMVYNSNYLLFLNRAIHLALGGRRHAVLRLDNFRFKASARLGHDVDVEVTQRPPTVDGNPQDSAAAPLLQAFEAVIKEAETPGQVFVTAEATALALPRERDAWPALFNSTFSSAAPIPDPMTDVVATPDKAMDTTVWLDELDVNGLVAPHAVLSMFERGRSDALGGPDRLEELMAEGCMFVVARVDGYRFDPSVLIEEGDELQVLGRFRRKGASIVACDQVVATKHEGAHGGRPAGTIVAQAVVTLACISAAGKMMAVPDKALGSMNLLQGGK